jgi:hypothetical protein
MPTPEDLAGGLDPQRLQQVLNAVHAQVATALWLSAGMLCAVATIACLAFGWRRPALGCGLLYSATLCFVHNGHAQLLGPAGCGLAVMGFLWPERRRRVPPRPSSSCGGPPRLNP